MGCGSSIERHRRESEELEVSFCVVVTSDKVLRGAYEDEVVPTVARVLSERGLRLESWAIVPNERSAVASEVTEKLKKCDIVLVSGGTGLGPRDVSVDVVSGMCTRSVPGFGELFRYLTYQLHGTAALATRAMACAVGDRLVFVVPGSPSAAALALDKLVLPEAKHLIAELRGLRH